VKYLPSVSAFVRSSLTPKQIERIAEWTREGIGQEIIAQRLGVSVRTVGRYVQRGGFR